MKQDWNIINSSYIKKAKEKQTIKELKKLVSLFEHRKLFTNDSIIMSGDLEKLKKLTNQLKQ
tara:strand:+ start:413 stop:598 length:186 start_codon:yes stop_codon:yes gene_type:complete